MPLPSLRGSVPGPTIHHCYCSPKRHREALGPRLKRNPHPQSGQERPPPLHRARLWSQQMLAAPGSESQACLSHPRSLQRPRSRSQLAQTGLRPAREAGNPLLTLVTPLSGSPPPGRSLGTRLRISQGAEWAARQPSMGLCSHPTLSREVHFPLRALLPGRKRNVYCLVPSGRHHTGDFSCLRSGPNT